jgi:tetratricopeptide (TPR) repeat protein
MNNLALVYEAQGKYTEAEPIFQQALTIQKKCFGAEKPQSTLRTHFAQEEARGLSLALAQGGVNGCT